jgi:hypothetical protein
MKPLITYEFCKMTKIHIDMELSNPGKEIDVSALIRILMATLEFEEDLHKKLASGQDIDPDDLKNSSVKVNKNGQVTIQGGTMAELRAKYGETSEEYKQQQAKAKTFKQFEGKTKISTHHYRFKGCISECFEPYMKCYAESEERKIMESLEEVCKVDGSETIDNMLSSSLHLFKNIKSSLKRCLSFSTSKALLDLHVVSSLQLS